MKTTKQAVSFTLSKDSVKWLKKSAKEQQLNRSQIVEKAISLMKQEEEKQQMIESFKRMKNDPEIKELAEMGIEDFKNMIDAEY